jgi:hypothetical protein
MIAAHAIGSHSILVTNSPDFQRHPGPVHRKLDGRGFDVFPSHLRNGSNGENRELRFSRIAYSKNLSNLWDLISSSLYALAPAITRFFDFDFDHAFGFYSKLTGNIYDSPVRYELFVDIGGGEGDARSVKRTRLMEVFPSIGTGMRFLFDYGDEWVFRVELVKRQPKEPKVTLPRLLMSAGKAPAQDPDPEDE